MTVYVVYDRILWEGCSPPLAAFSSQELADAFIQGRAKEDYPYSDKSWGVAKLSIDAE